MATSGLLHSGHGEMENMKAIEQSLLEQMRIDKIEIARRQEMLGFSQKDADLLAWCKPLIKDGIGSLVADFYEREVDYDLENLSSALEPFLIVAVGGMVLILALGVFLPLWDMAASGGGLT